MSIEDLENEDLLVEANLKYKNARAEFNGSISNLNSAIADLGACVLFDTNASQEEKDEVAGYQEKVDSVIV